MNLARKSRIKMLVENFYLMSLRLCKVFEVFKLAIMTSFINTKMSNKNIFQKRIYYTSMFFNSLFV